MSNPMKLKGKRANIDVTLGSGTQSVPALVFGPYLALHKRIDVGGWRVTHIPTGLRIMRANTQKHGRLLIERLLSLDWTPEVAVTNGPAVRRIAAELAP